jgi:hypothetical protein
MSKTEAEINFFKPNKQKNQNAKGGRSVLVENTHINMFEIQ